MPKGGLTYTFDAAALQRAITGLDKDLKASMWVPTKRMAEQIDTEIHNRVLQGKAGLTGGNNLEGGAIADNAPKTIRRKERKGRSGPNGVRSLYDTGVLMGTWRHTVDKDPMHPSTTIHLPDSRVKIVGYLASPGRKIRYINWFGWPVTINGKGTYNVFVDLIRRNVQGVLKRVARRGLTRSK